MEEKIILRSQLKCTVCWPVDTRFSSIRSIGIRKKFAFVITDSYSSFHGIPNVNQNSETETNINQPSYKLILCGEIEIKSDFQFQLNECNICKNSYDFMFHAVSKVLSINFIFVFFLILEVIVRYHRAVKNTNKI